MFLTVLWFVIIMGVSIALLAIAGVIKDGILPVILSIVAIYLLAFAINMVFQAQSEHVANLTIDLMLERGLLAVKQ